MPVADTTFITTGSGAALAVNAVAHSRVAQAYFTWFLIKLSSAIIGTAMVYGF
jgi:hypothetical protein